MLNVRAGKLSLALSVFYTMDDDEKNLVSWNSMINGCAQFLNGINIAQHLFDQMPAHDSVSWNLRIDVYIKQGIFNQEHRLISLISYSINLLLISVTRVLSIRRLINRFTRR